MPSSDQQTLGDALGELETILKIRQRLEDRACKDYLFTPEWMDNLLTTKVRELSDAEETLSTHERLQYLSRILDCHFALIERALTGLADQLTIVIVRQKSKLEEHSGVSEITTSGRVCPESPLGGPPEGWKLEAFGTRYDDLRGGNLRLIWDNYTTAMKVWKGQKNSANRFLDLPIFPGDIEQFSYSKKGSEVLLQQCLQERTGTRIYLRLENSEAVSSLYDFLVQVSVNADLVRQCLSRYTLK
ncbi:MAG: hypothetical protein Q9226_000145 [Calogaya cf. arnoldii]